MYYIIHSLNDQKCNDCGIRLGPSIPENHWWLMSLVLVYRYKVRTQLLRVEFFQLNFKQIVLHKSRQSIQLSPGRRQSVLASANHREKLFPNKYTGRRDRILVSYHCRFNEMLLTLAYILLLYNIIIYRYLLYIVFFSRSTFSFYYTSVIPTYCCLRRPPPSKK